MAPVVLLFLVSSLLHAHGSSAVTPVFVKTGGNVSLNVNEADVPQEFIFVEWKFNTKTLLVRFFPAAKPAVATDYKGRIEFPMKNYSILLKNLQETDSGDYTSQMARGAENKILAEYNVIVQDPVSPVNLTVDSVSTSSVSCNLTVSCKAQDAHITSTFTCDNQTCSQEGGERSKVTTSGSILKVYLVNGTIICKHSNQVSRKEGMTEIQNVCLQHLKPQASKNITAVVVVVPTVFLIGAGGLVYYLYKKRKDEREGTENTIYEIPQVGATAQLRNQSPTADSSGFSPTSTYCTVGPHTGPVAPESRGTALPESLYAQVEKPPKSSDNV